MPTSYFIFPSPKVIFFDLNSNEENIKERKGTESNNWKEVDQHVVFGTVDQKEKGWQLPVASWDGQFSDE
jgi:hypothetical protein